MQKNFTLSVLNIIQPQIDYQLLCGERHRRLTFEQLKITPSQNNVNFFITFLSLTSLTRLHCQYHGPQFNQH